LEKRSSTNRIQYDVPSHGSPETDRQLGVLHAANFVAIALGETLVLVGIISARHMRLMKTEKIN
jgi:TIR domain